MTGRPDPATDPEPDETPESESDRVVLARVDGEPVHASPEAVQEVLPAVGVRKRSLHSPRVHRAADLDAPDEALRPACIVDETTVNDPAPNRDTGVFKRVTPGDVIRFGKFELCKNPPCFRDLIYSHHNHHEGGEDSDAGGAADGTPVNPGSDRSERPPSGSPSASTRPAGHGGRGGVVFVCPECGDSQLYRRGGGRNRSKASSAWRCRACGAEFRDPDRRSRATVANRGNINPIGKALLDAEPGDLVPDGGTRTTRSVRCENCGDRDAVTERTTIVDVAELEKTWIKTLGLCRRCANAFDWGSGHPPPDVAGRDRPLLEPTPAGQLIPDGGTEAGDRECEPFYCTECDWQGFECEVEFGPPVPLPDYALTDTVPRYMRCPECGGEVEPGERPRHTGSVRGAPVTDGGTEPPGNSQLKDDVEVSVHHRFYEDSVRDGVEYEVHTGLAEEYVISEELAQRVYAEVGLDLWNGDYRAGCEVRIVGEGDDGGSGVEPGRTMTDGGFDAGDGDVDLPRACPSCGTLCHAVYTTTAGESISCPNPDCPRNQPRRDTGSDRGPPRGDGGTGTNDSERYEVNLQVGEVVSVELDAEHTEAAILEAIDRVESEGKHVTRLLTAAEKGKPILSDGEVIEHESLAFFRDIQAEKGGNSDTGSERGPLRTDGGIETADRERVDVPVDVLWRLVSFAEIHGEVHGDADLYFAVRNAKVALDRDDVEPHFPWREAWSDHHGDPEGDPGRPVTDGGQPAGVEFRRDDATEDGEGWPKARPAPFNLHAEYGPIGIGFFEDVIEDVALWAAAATPMDAVSIALATTCDDGSDVTAVAYMDPPAARAFAAQLLTAADAVDRNERWDPNNCRSAARYQDLGTDQAGGPDLRADGGRAADSLGQPGVPPRYDDYHVVCPAPGCVEGFYTYHDEHAVTTLIYHLRKEHPSLLHNLRVALGGVDAAPNPDPDSDADGEQDQDQDQDQDSDETQADGGRPAEAFTVGTRVRTRRDFSGVPAGTEGVVDEDYGSGVMIAWDLEDKPLPDGYERKPEDEMRPTTEDPDGFEMPILRDGFDKATELQFLKIVDDETPSPATDDGNPPLADVIETLGRYRTSPLRFPLHVLDEHGDALCGNLPADQQRYLERYGYRDQPTLPEKRGSEPWPSFLDSLCGNCRAVLLARVDAPALREAWAARQEAIKRV